MERILIDNDAKMRVYLHKLRDSNNYPYYIGKIQFPGTLNFERGVSFMIFTAEEGSEEIQIAPLDPNRRSKSKRGGIGFKNGKITIDLHPFEDSAGEILYTGEAQGPAVTDCTHGLFFTVFVSREGYEEMSISRLDHTHMKRRRPEFDISYENENGTTSIEAKNYDDHDSVNP